MEILNIADVPQRRSLRELQAEYPFSLHKTLVPERALFDYSSFRRSECYSRLSEEEIADRIEPYANAFDFAIRERADLVMEWVPDCFIPAMAGRIAAYYDKPFRMFLPHYWWKDGGTFLDRMDSTSSEVDEHYSRFYAHPELCDRERLDKVFGTKQILYRFSSSEMYTLAMRARVVINRLSSYEPPSVLHWLVRRSRKVLSSGRIRTMIPRLKRVNEDPFVLYPLHQTPEASMLGASPELADQFSLIKNISMNLPYGVKLYVKEHPSQVLGTGIDFDFYRRLHSLPNVRILRAEVRLDEVLDHPSFIAVAVINGTAAFEAAQKRKPAFVFGRATFSVADCFLKPANFEEFYTQLLTITRGEFHFDERALYAILNAYDAAVVHADVDFTACRTADQLMLAFPPIFRNFVLARRWAKA